MGNKKQTGIEWLFEQVVNLDWGNLNGEQKIKILQQAKEMDKQNIIDAVDGFPIENRNMLGEEYYQETYGE